MVAGVSAVGRTSSGRTVVVAGDGALEIAQAVLTTALVGDLLVDYARAGVAVVVLRRVLDPCPPCAAGPGGIDLAGAPWQGQGPRGIGHSVVATLCRYLSVSCSKRTLPQTSTGPPAPTRAIEGMDTTVTRSEIVPASYVDALGRIDDAAVALQRYPNETLLLQALMANLPAVPP